jgi:acetyl-CoA C-acetyltransferase
MATDTLALHDRPNPLSLTAARISIERACEKAKVTPLQMDLFELYDSYSIFSALLLEAAGYAAPGEGWTLARSECIGLHGSVPISTMGGLKARGNPGGATGVYQAVEAVIQLRGSANPSIQLGGARVGMIQSLGGPASTAVTHILERI